jgi:very-short-patch-repair endonuclease
VGGELDTRERDRRIAALAGRQRGMITRVQLVALGLSHRVIDDWIARGRLHVIHRGVYALGHRALAAGGAWMAAVLASGKGAVLSHRSAAAHWELRHTAAARVDITVPGTAGRLGQCGIVLHRSSTLSPGDVTHHEGIPVTSVARTLVDLAEVVPQRALERAVDQAEVVRRLDARGVEAVIAAHPRRPGCVRMRRILDAHSVGTTLTRSELEELVLSICTRAALPRPEVNRRVAGLEVDFLWRTQRLIAEADSRRYHATRVAFERDRERDARLLLHGFRVVRLTERRLTTDPSGVGDLLAALLGARVSISPPGGW